MLAKRRQTKSNAPNLESIVASLSPSDQRRLTQLLTPASRCSVTISFVKVKRHTNVSITASTVPGRVGKDTITRLKPSQPSTVSNEPPDIARPAWHPRKLTAKISRPAGEAGRPSGGRGFSLKQELQLDAQLYLHIRVRFLFGIIFNTCCTN